ncbi:AGAP005349-PA-like protein [Anopheles sinensis]|uniref:AGAP005349-PA-like protein n=1 Tax=Anopheles sinensis TaxID=74873 RepID=A0A084W152_ANOSI|nr:AGAP005349-PA-like protein [Anopheles sinensis]
MERRTVTEFVRARFDRLRRDYPNAHRLLVGEKRADLLLLRVLLLTLYGLAVGFLFYRLVLVNLDLPDTVLFYLGLSVALALGLGCALSAQVRCICALCWMGFFGRAGRNVLKTLTITLVVTGPIENMALNGKEVIRVLTCSAELAFNLTLTRLDLMSKPFQNALLQGRTKLPELKQEFYGIVSIVKPIVREVELPTPSENELDEDSQESENVVGESNLPKNPSVLTASEYQQLYTAKLNERCHAQLQNGVDRCKKAFERTYDECHESLPVLVNTLLCWPMKIDFACSSAELFGVGTVCQMEDVLDADFGENYRLLRQTEQQLTGGVDVIDIDYQVPDLRNHSGYLTIKSASKRMTKEFGEKKLLLRGVLYVMRKVLAFIFLRVIYRAVQYHDAYLWKIDFQNFYITDQFRKIDERRAADESHHLPLLPLRAVQRFRLVDIGAGICNNLELRHVLGSIALVSFHCLSTTILILMDALLSETLAIVARHSKIEYHMQGYHSVNVTVSGSGALAELIRNIAEGFRTDETLNLQTSNEECLPRPLRLDIGSIAAIYGMFVLLAALIVIEAYVQRARRSICAFFYPGREQMRTVFLYNRVLRESKILRRTLETRIDRLKSDHGTRRPIPFRERIAVHHPVLLGWVRSGRCSICRGNGVSDECLQCDCFLRYCAGCWQDVGQQCVCQTVPGPPRCTTTERSHCCNPLVTL